MGKLRMGRPDEARRLAFKVLQPDRMVEYHCYSERGRDQGVALVRFEQWIDRDHLKFKGTNLAASDEYYDWWAKRNWIPTCLQVQPAEPGEQQVAAGPWADGQMLFQFLFSSANAASVPYPSPIRV